MPRRAEKQLINRHLFTLYNYTTLYSLYLFLKSVEPLEIVINSHTRGFITFILISNFSTLDDVRFHSPNQKTENYYEKQDWETERLTRLEESGYCKWTNNSYRLKPFSIRHVKHLGLKTCGQNELHSQQSINQMCNNLTAIKHQGCVFLRYLLFCYSIYFIFSVLPESQDISGSKMFPRCGRCRISELSTWQKWFGEWPVSTYILAIFVLSLIHFSLRQKKKQSGKQQVRNNRQSRTWLRIDNNPPPKHVHLAKISR